MVISATGHRPPKCGIDYNLISPVSLNIKRAIRDALIKEKPDKCISGMALGIDTLFALLSLELNIPLIAAIPCRDQEKIWPQRSQAVYNSILSNSLTQSKLITDDYYSPSCMQTRNIWMVDNSDLIIAVWDGSTGGTSNCVRYAKSTKKPIIRINPANLI